MILTILDRLFAIAGISILISIITFIGMMLFSKRPNPKVIMGMIVIFMLTLSLAFTFPSVARSELREKLSQTVIKTTSDKSIDREAVLASLKLISYVSGTNSHPLERFNFKIQTSTEVINLQLARDSIDSNKYWVFYPKYPATSINEIGKILLK